MGSYRHLDLITMDPGKCGGRACIRGLRIRVIDVLQLLAHGATWPEVIEHYPDITLEDIRGCLEYAAAQQDHAILQSA